MRPRGQMLGEGPSLLWKGCGSGLAFACCATQLAVKFEEEICLWLPLSGLNPSRYWCEPKTHLEKLREPSAENYPRAHMIPFCLVDRWKGSKHLQILAVKWLDFNHSTTISKHVKCFPTTSMFVAGDWPRSRPISGRWLILLGHPDVHPGLTS